MLTPHTTPGDRVEIHGTGTPHDGQLGTVHRMGVYRAVVISDYDGNHIEIHLNQATSTTRSQRSPYVEDDAVIIGKPGLGDHGDVGIIKTGSRDTTTHMWFYGVQMMGTAEIRTYPASELRMGVASRLTPPTRDQSDNTRHALDRYAQPLGWTLRGVNGSHTHTDYTYGAQTVDIVWSSRLPVNTFWTLGDRLSGRIDAQNGVTDFASLRQAFRRGAWFAERDKLLDESIAGVPHRTSPFRDGIDTAPPAPPTPIIYTGAPR